MKLIVISSSADIENEVQTVIQLFEAGLETFHIRKHRLSTRKMKNFIAAIPPHFHNRIVIHSHHKLARRFKLKGIHLTKSHKQKKWSTWLTIKLVKLRNPGIILTTSYSTIGQILATKQDHEYDYVFLSPIFDNFNSKFQGGFTEHSLRSALQKSALQIVARGGVDIGTVDKANDIGFAGLAFYTSIWRSKNPLEEFNKIVEKFQDLKIPIQ
ncbi:MAG: thiamine phosphate synthase [Bacteroidetes bacterium]|jgi:thiamine-phosphate pyrophosphorylase|nr:thiamine phosphate synthase [Bacteroidota bacterium]